MERLQKVIAQAGICSRRKAEELILDGKVKVNGKVCDVLGTKVSNQDSIEVNGNMISLKDVKDEVFASGVLGEGFAMEPSDGEVKSPCNGTITAVAETGHAIGIVSDHGAEVLIHIGMDTVKMNGKGFKVHVKVGQKVKAKQPLVTVDLAKVKEAGYDTGEHIQSAVPDVRGTGACRNVWQDRQYIQEKGQSQDRRQHKRILFRIRSHEIGKGRIRAGFQ